MPSRKVSEAGRRIATVGVVVLLTTTVSVLYEVEQGALTSTSLATVIGFYLATSGIITFFAVHTAEQLGLPSLLMLRSEPAARRWGRLLLWGGGLGLLMSVASSALTVDPSNSALRPWFLRPVETPWDNFLLSAKAAVLEETFFRLFLIPFLVSMAMRAGRPRFRLRLEDCSAQAEIEPARRARWMVVAALVASALLFGGVHPFNPVPAVVFGTALGMAFLKGGWESAVLAHFLANYLVFSAFV